MPHTFRVNFKISSLANFDASRLGWDWNENANAYHRNVEKKKPQLGFFYRHRVEFVELVKRKNNFSSVWIKSGLSIKIRIFLVKRKVLRDHRKYLLKQWACLSSLCIWHSSRQNFHQFNTVEREKRRKNRTCCYKRQQNGFGSINSIFIYRN